MYYQSCYNLRVFFTASRRASRKRAISASPYSEMDLSTLIRYSPTALHLLNGGSPTSSGSYGHLSPTGALSPALGTVSYRMKIIACFGHKDVKHKFDIYFWKNLTLLWSNFLLKSLNFEQKCD